jgi:AAA family ATPase
MVKKSIDAKVRPLANTSLEKASLLGAARLYVSKDSLIALTGGLDNGKACFIEKLDGEVTEDGSGPLRREASLWVLPEKNLSPNVVMTTRTFQEATGFKIGDQVRLSLAEAGTPDADEVVVKDMTEATTGKEDEAGMKHPLSWEASVSLSLGTHAMEICIAPSTPKLR